MKKFFSENLILKLIVLLPILAIILSSFILTNIYIESEKETFKDDIAVIKDLHEKKIKSTIKQRVNRVFNILKAQESSNETKYKQEIKDIVDMGYNLLESTYNEYKELGKDIVIKELRTNFRHLRFFEDKTGYFFIYDLEGTNLVISPWPKFEGKNLLNLKDPQGNFIIKDIIQDVKKRHSGFKVWKWWDLKDPSKAVDKLGYYKYFEPLDVFIGTGRYVRDIKEDNKKQSIAFLNNIAYEDESYIFAIDENKKAMVHKNINILNVPYNKLPKFEQEIVSNIIKQAQSNLKEGAFIEYKPSTQKDINRPSHKISYVKYYPQLKLTLGTGLYTTDLNSNIEAKTLALEERLQRNIQKTLFTAFIVTLVLIVLMIIIAFSLKDILNNYAKSLEEKNLRLKELNNSLEQRVTHAVAENREKDEILYQQSKMAAMGEMLGNIAHQWRQPLSAISTAASGMKVQEEMGILDRELMHNELDAIVKNTQTLSHTIDDFRNFFKNNKIPTCFEIGQSFTKVSTLISANLTNKNIQLIKEIDTIEIKSYKNELVQALLNIINNSRDALILNLSENEKRLIFIRVYKEEDMAVIEIKDNGKGIDETILSKVFEPYFTTKHQSQGTGIGLYMTQKIISSSLKGSISISNTAYEYQGNQYTGALCEIRLPLCITSSSQEDSNNNQSHLQ